MGVLNNLPVLMSPTIPPWPAPPRSTTGGKHPGKLPKVPANFGSSSDGSSDSGSDSDMSSKDMDGVVSMSDADTNTRPRLQIGRKTSGRKAESVGGKRPGGAVSGKAVPDSVRRTTIDSLARKTPVGQCCCVLSSRQVSELPRRHLGMAMANSPVVIKINIPTYLLPVLKSGQQPERSKTDSKPKSAYKLDLSTSKTKHFDAERKTDAGSSIGTSKEDSVKSGRYGGREDGKKDLQTKDSRSSSGNLKSTVRRSLSFSSDDGSNVEDRRRVKSKYSKGSTVRGSVDTDKEDGADLRRYRDRDEGKKVSKPRESHQSPTISKGIRKRSRSCSSEDDSDAEERKKAKGKYSKDSTLGDHPYDRRATGTDNVASGGDTKRAPSSKSSAKSKAEAVDDKRNKDDRKELGSLDAPIRPKSSYSLSPVLERNNTKNRPTTYRSADEGDDRTSLKSQSMSKYNRSKDLSDSKDGRSRLESKENKSKSDSTPPLRKPGDAKDRDSDASEARRRIREDGRARETKEKAIHMEKPSTVASTKEKEGKLAKENNIPVSSRTGSKNDSNSSKSDRNHSAAAPSSPNRRSGKEGQKDAKSRGERDSRDDTAASGQRSSAGAKERPAKDRARGRSHTPSRTRSRSRSPRGRYDRKRSISRNDARDSKSTRDRRDYDDDRTEDRGMVVEIATTAPAEGAAGIDSDAIEVEIEAETGVGIGVETEARIVVVTEAKTVGLVWNEAGTENGPGHVSRMDTRADVKPQQLQQHESSKASTSRRESESKHGTPVVASNSVRRPSQAIKEQTPSPPIPTSVSNSNPADVRGQQDSLQNSSLTASATPIKRVSIEDYQRKKNNNAENNNVDTPKAASDSPALAAATALGSKAALPSKESGHKPTAGEPKPSSSTSSSSKPSSETGKKMAEYYNTFRLRRAEGTTFKHSADDTLKNQNNPRLGAIMYFLSAIEFIAAFHANDKYHTLSNPGRPDVAVKESIKSWETMRQFIYALTNQCHSNHLTGLDGVSALMEVLVYYKCYNFNIMALRKDMLKSEQFKNKPSPGASKDETVAISQEMAGRMLQNVEDWAHIQKRLEDCRQWLTADIARGQFPDTFRRWCIHPDQIGQAGLSFDRFVPGTAIQKIHWPLGLHLHLSELMGFVEAALDEFQKRNGLDNTQRDT
ncbi:hypothetical protein BGZ75_005298 [Mortierella antarctica]|nr:hypothetical protein BGZ75_005298 [Mortierella antarctica]